VTPEPRAEAIPEPSAREAPDNPFAAGGVGARYARGRPFHHPRALALALELLGEERARRALDVACGTGLSTRALLDIADAVVGVDRSPEMLVVAAEVPGVTVVRGAAERLPFPDASFDAVTVCSGVHWFDQPAFFAEIRRLLRPGGWVVLYDHYFIGEMVDVPEFATWTQSTFERHPLPPRNHQVGDPRGEAPDTFDRIAEEFYADDIPMTQDEFVDYQLSLSNFVAASERGTPATELRDWLVTTTAPFYEGAAVRTVRFLGTVTCLRVAQDAP
jgi:SAM-dependent methyltransferase